MQTFGTAGAVDDAVIATRDALDELSLAFDAAEDEGLTAVAAELLKLHGELDDVANRLARQREALR